MLAVFSAGVLLPIIFILYLFISLIIRGNSQILLCMECDQCIKVCPIVKKYPDAPSPKDIMEAIKTGNLKKLDEKGTIKCNSCGACERACPRGLAPYKEWLKLKHNYAEIKQNKKYEGIQINTIPLKLKS